VADLLIEAAVDNDIVLKAVSYGLAERFWPSGDDERSIGVLGATRFVLMKAIRKGNRVRDADGALDRLNELLEEAITLEPTEDELRLAASLELEAQRQGLDLDTGESQLAAIVVSRNLDRLESGDKRAITSIECLIDHVAEIAALAGKLRCLEQILLRILADDFDEVAAAICREQDVDRALSICFSCYSSGSPTQENVVEGLESYIGAVRSEAPRVLVTP
jgi:hypothetical protein